MARIILDFGQMIQCLSLNHLMSFFFLCSISVVCPVICLISICIFDPYFRQYADNFDSDFFCLLVMLICSVVIICLAVCSLFTTKETYNCVLFAMGYFLVQIVGVLVYTTMGIILAVISRTKKFINESKLKKSSI